MDFDPELTRTFDGEDFFGDVFFIVPSCSLVFGFLFADKYLIEKFNASFSVVVVVGDDDDRKSFVVIC